MRTRIIVVLAVVCAMVTRYAPLLFK